MHDHNNIVKTMNELRGGEIGLRQQTDFENVDEDLRLLTFQRKKKDSYQYSNNEINLFKQKELSITNDTSSFNEFEFKHQDIRRKSDIFKNAD